MFKKKLVTSFALGMCLMTLSTGSVVFAAETETKEAVQQEILMVEGTSTDSYVGTVAEVEYDEALLERQREIEQIVFIDSAEEIAALGFQVSSIGIMNESIELGITPYTEESANYLYEKLGKESVQIVKGLPIEIYTTAVADAPDVAVSEEVAEGVTGGGTDSYVGEGVVLEEGQMGITSFDENALDTPVSNDKAGEDLGDGKVYKGTDLEVTSVGEIEPATDASYDPQIAEMTIQGADTEKEDNSSLFIAIAAGAGAILLGGFAFLARKMKLKK